jgi:surfactin synthase thioesterase subunit
VNIPGHDIGGSDELLGVEEIAERVVSEIKERIHGKIVLYGHCVGNAVMVETARLLEQAQIKIELVIIGANFPPKNVKYYGNFFDPWMLFSDSGIIDYLGGLGLSKNALDNEYADFVIRALRHDARSFYRYFYRLSRRKEEKQRLTAKCLCIAGEKDSITRGYLKRYHAWEMYFDDPELYVIKDGEHYFINSHAKELAQVIHNELTKT